MSGRALAWPLTSIATDAWTALEQSLQIWQKQDDEQGVCLVNAYVAEVALWLGDWATARTRADRAWELAEVDKFEADFIRAARLQGTAALRGWVARSEPTGEGRGFGSSHQVTPSAEAQGTPPTLVNESHLHATERGADQPDTPTAEFAHERLLYALTRARACQLVEEELPALIALAELHEAWARRTLHLSWSTIPSCSNSAAAAATSKTSVAEHVGNVLHVAQPDASAFRLMGLTATEHLTEAQRYLDDVWDRAQRGPYPTFHADAFNQLANAQHAAVKAYGLAQATEHLQTLGVPLPSLKPFDESQYEPIPDVPIIPPPKEAPTQTPPEVGRDPDHGKELRVTSRMLQRAHSISVIRMRSNNLRVRL